MKGVRYALWAMPVNDESVVFATENEFSRVGDSRVLVYRPDGEKPDGDVPETAMRFTDGDAAAFLTEPELRWLTKCNVTVIERTVDRYRVPMQNAVPDFLERLKTELENVRREKDAEKAGLSTEE